MYGHVYVARVAFGAKMSQTVQAFLEAEAYPGTSLIIAYSHCIAHGYDMANGAIQQKLAVDSGVWPLYRFDPRRIAKGEPPMHLDYGPPKPLVADYMRNESRFRVVERSDPDRFKGFLKDAQDAARQRYAVYQQLAGITVPARLRTGDEASPAAPKARTDDGPQHGLSRPSAAAPAGGGRVAAGRRHRRRATSRRRRRRRDRSAIAVRRTDRTREQMSEFDHLDTSWRNRSPKPPAIFPSPDAFALGPFSTSNHLRRAKEAVRVPVIASLNGATPGGWIDYAQLMEEARGGRAGAEPVSDRDRPGDDRRGHRAPGHRDGPRRQERGHDSGRRQTVAVLRRLRQPRPRARPGRRRRPGAVQSFLPAGYRRRGADRLAHAAPLGFLGAAPAAALDRDSLGASPRVAGGHRRRPHGARRRQGDDGGGARHADGLSAADPRARRICEQSSAISRRGWRSTSGTRSPACAAT